MRTLSGMPLDSSGQKIDNRFTPSRREGDRIDGSKLETPAKSLGLPPYDEAEGQK